MSERQAAVAALHGSLTTRASEAAQPRGGAYETATKTQLNDALFVTSQQNAWNARADVMRKNIIALNLQERAVERRVGTWSPLPPPLSSPAPAVPAASEPDPVIGQWSLKGSTPLTLAADHSISGGRHGSWLYTCTTDAGRHYELHWNPPKNWVDYMVLTGSGETLDGKSRWNQRIQAFR